MRITIMEVKINVWRFRIRLRIWLMELIVLQPFVLQPMVLGWRTRVWPRMVNNTYRKHFAIIH